MISLVEYDRQSFRTEKRYPFAIRRKNKVNHELRNRRALPGLVISVPTNPMLARPGLGISSSCRIVIVDFYGAFRGSEFSSDLFVEHSRNDHGNYLCSREVNESKRCRSSATSLSCLRLARSRSNATRTASKRSWSRNGLVRNSTAPAFRSLLGDILRTPRPAYGRPVPQV